MEPRSYGPRTLRLGHKSEYKKLGPQPTVQTSYLASERYQTLATNIESVNLK